MFNAMQDNMMTKSSDLLIDIESASEVACRILPAPAGSTERLSAMVATGPARAPLKSSPGRPQGHVVEPRATARWQDLIREDQEPWLLTKIIYAKMALSVTR